MLRTFHALGYSSVHVVSGYPLTDANEHVDVNLDCGGGNEFEQLLLDTTILGPFRWFLVGDRARRRILCSFSSLPDAAREASRPVFAFAHIVSPHPPYLFGPNGEPVAYMTRTIGLAADLWEERDKYLDQVKFLNDQVLDLVDALLEASEPSPIIVLQSDHGPASVGGDWEAPSEALIRERMSILNAYHLPGDGATLLYPSISPVNTFRLILNHYFDHETDLLPDRSYFSGYEQQFEYNDVSDLLRNTTVQQRN